MDKKEDGFQSEKIVVLPQYIMDEMLTYPHIRPLFITDIGFYPRAVNHYRERAFGCDSHILIYCISGEGMVTIADDHTYRIRERTLIVIPADTPHSYGADESNPWSIYWFHIYGEEVAEFLQALSLTDNPVKLSTSEEEKFVTLFHQCYDTLSTKSYSMPHHVHVSQTVRYILSLIGLIPIRNEDERKQQYVEQAIQFMKERLEHTLSLDELVFHTRISRQHLNHIFKTSTGYTPIDYYHRMKMQRAGQLLDLTGFSIKEICHSLGFADPYYFSRIFKKIIGTSPSNYRSKLKG